MMKYPASKRAVLAYDACVQLGTTTAAAVTLLRECAERLDVVSREAARTRIIVSEHHLDAAPQMTPSNLERMAATGAATVRRLADDLARLECELRPEPEPIAEA